MFHLRRGGPPAVVDKKIIKQKKLIMGFWFVVQFMFLSLPTSSFRFLRRFLVFITTLNHVLEISPLIQRQR